MSKMQLPNSTTLLLNGAAIVIGLASLGVVLRSIFAPDQLASCKERFENATRLSLEREGVLMTASDLQGQAANSDWGLIEAANIVTLSSGPSKVAIEVDLAAVPSASRDASAGRAGAGFNWVPQSFRKPKAACLSYSVFVPEGFKFGRGGRLPGLYGVSEQDSSEGAGEFTTRFTWNTSGEIDIYAQLPGLTESRSLGGKRGTLALQPGQWAELDQELVLNTPGQKDGIIRVWQNGALVVERTDVIFRMRPSATLTGVMAEIAAGEGVVDKPGAQTILITPFVLLWQ